MDGYKKRKITRTRSLKRTRSYPRPRAFTLSKNILRDKQRVTMRYSTQVTLSGDVAGSFGHIFDANGLYDPDRTGFGHQPRGFDEMMALYSKYVVTDAKVLCRFRNASNARIIPFIIVTDNQTLGSGVTDALEHSGCVSGTRRLARTSTPDESGIANQMALRHHVNVPKWKGVKDLLADTSLQGSNVTNPADSIYFIVGGVTDGAFNLVMDVDMEFTAYMLDPKQPGQS